MALLVDATPHLRLVQCREHLLGICTSPALAADRPKDYPQRCWLAADGADEKVTLCTQVRAYAAEHMGAVVAG